jgi:hypothetical protein
MATLYSAGPCSVCVDASEAIIARSASSRQLFYMCGSCGIAWDAPPTAGVVDTMDPVEKYAPSGIELPTLDELRAAGLERLVRKTLTNADWMVDDYLAR